MAKTQIKIIPVEYSEVVDLLHSDCLQQVEKAIASQTGMRIVEDYSPACTSYTQAEISVSGLTTAQLRELLASHRDEIIAFGIAFLRDEAATQDDEEFPEGEEQDASEAIEVLGLGVGFGIRYAIWFNFLANRSTAEFNTFLENRRVPHRAKFARELRRVFQKIRAS